VDQNPQATDSRLTTPKSLAHAGHLLSKLFVGFLVPALVILVWHLLADPQIRNLPLMKNSGAAAFLPSPQALPPPLKVLARWIEYASPREPFDPAKTNFVQWVFSGELPSDALASLSRVLIGFAIGTLLALPLGLFMGVNQTVFRLFNPTIEILRPIPPIAYIPLAMLWFGLGNPPAYFLISLGAFFPVLINTIGGVRNVDSIFIRAAQNLGAGGMTMFWRIILPAATPHILTGVRVGLGVAFIVVIVAEMIAVNSGVGYRILEAREYTYTDKVIAGMFTIGLLGLGLDLIVSRINNYLLRWHRGLDQIKN
jgi:NitT/TauT family transport system permease protein